LDALPDRKSFLEPFGTALFLRTFGCFACPFGGLGIVCCRLMIFPGVSLLDWNLSAVLPFMRHHRLFGGIRGGYSRRISFEKFEW